MCTPLEAGTHTVRTPPTAQAAGSITGRPARCVARRSPNPQYAAVLVIDVDQWGTEGGRPENLNGQIKTIIAQMIQRNIGPAWVGINPQSGKAQMLWLIDPVYAGPDGSGRHMGLLKAATRTLGQMLDHDPHFSHRFSRSPFYEGKDPTAYRWHCQHKRVVRLSQRSAAWGCVLVSSMSGGCDCPSHAPL
ncbi:replication initiation protein [Corynebacterium mastitidis]|uniref:replication initiation protein n=1 Tax=Corynebacterium mastitidis TaxID=161890 RepID=UPI0030E8BA96